MTKIIAISGSRKIIYAQKDPYSLVTYDIVTHEEMRFERKAPFETEDNLQIEIKENNGVRYSNGPRSGIALSPIIVDNKIVVAVFDGDGRNNFLDVYNLNMKHLYRLQIPPLEKDVRPFKLCFYKMQMLLLVSGPAIINWVERMRVDFIH